jgi:hypothetical protein
MKLSKQTIEVLSWCSKLNPDLLLTPGHIVRTITHNKAVLLKVLLQDTFPVECAFNLKSLLKDLDSETDVSFEHPDYIFLRKGRTSTKVPKIDPQLVMAPPSRELKIDTFQEKAFLHVDDLLEMQLAAKCVHRKPSNTGKVSPKHLFVFHAEEQGAPIQLDICRDNVVRTLELKVPRKANGPFRAIIRRENLVLLEGSYEVEFSKVSVTRWKGLNVSATAWVALESKLGFFGEKPKDEQPKEIAQGDVQAA